MEFVDGEGNIIVPKSVRPIIELRQTPFGSKKGASRQFRHGTLHIREYESHYSVHLDKVDPLRDPLGHLVVDAPEYLAGAAAAALVGRRVGMAVYEKRKGQGRPQTSAAVDAVLAGYLAGSAAGRIIHDAASQWKMERRR